MNESLSFTEKSENLPQNIPFDPANQKSVVDPIVAKESWSKLLGKRVVPRCEHNEPCISYTTKKPGVNCGRSFYMCPRPIGPSGQKERNTQWRCGTFIWSSDWTGDGTWEDISLNRVDLWAAKAPLSDLLWSPAHKCCRGPETKHQTPVFSISNNLICLFPAPTAFNQPKTTAIPSRKQMQRSLW
jgi:hypothetical protein